MLVLYIKVGYISQIGARGLVYYIEVCGITSTHTSIISVAKNNVGIVFTVYRMSVASESDFDSDDVVADPSFVSLEQLTASGQRKRRGDNSAVNESLPSKVPKLEEVTLFKGEFYTCAEYVS